MSAVRACGKTDPKTREMYILPHKSHSLFQITRCSERFVKNNYERQWKTAGTYIHTNIHIHTYAYPSGKIRQSSGDTLGPLILHTGIFWKCYWYPSATWREKHEQRKYGTLQGICCLPLRFSCSLLFERSGH